jgi:hypothetical protein
VIPVSSAHADSRRRFSVEGSLGQAPSRVARLRQARRGGWCAPEVRLLFPFVTGVWQRCWRGVIDRSAPPRYINKLRIRLAPDLAHPSLSFRLLLSNASQIFTSLLSSIYAFDTSVPSSHYDRIPRLTRQHTSSRNGSQDSNQIGGRLQGQVLQQRPCLLPGRSPDICTHASWNRLLTC